jgi:hypothetical protein
MTLTIDGDEKKFKIKNEPYEGKLSRTVLRGERG